MINKFKDFVKNNRVDIYYILLLLGILLIMGIPKLISQYNIGIANWDTYLYLENGRLFAKMGWGDVPSISPVLPMALAKLFLISGHVYPEAIFTLDLVFYILGVVSLYLLFRYKFNQNISFLGSLIYATFTLLYSWVCIGGNDIIGVSGTILTVYLIVISNKYSYKFYLLALPVAAYSFLSRYTAGVMIFAILFFILINKVNLKEIKYIVLGSILGVISISWFLYEFNKALNTPFPFIGQFTGTVQNTPVLDSGYVPDNLYFIRNLPQYLSSYVNINDFDSLVNPSNNIPTIFSYILIILMIIGFIVLIYKVYSVITSSNKKFLTNKNMLLLAILSIVAIICIVTIGTSYIITIALFLVVLGGLYYLLEDYDIDKLDYEFLMITLFVVYLVFQSILTTKNDRYFITVLPFIAYFITCAFEFIYGIIKKKLNISYGFVDITHIITACIVIFLVASSLTYTANIPQKNHYNDIEEACTWLTEYDGNLTNQTMITSDNWPAVTWYLNIYAERGVLDVYNQSQIWLFSKQRLSQNDTHHAASYYIDTNNKVKADYPGFTKIYNKGDVTIYQNTYLYENKDASVESEDYIKYIDGFLENNRKYYGDINESAQLG